MVEHVQLRIDQGVASLSFFHEKANSLTQSMLLEMTERLQEIAADASVSVVALQSAGERAFCAGASFQEFAKLSTKEEATDFFLSFGKLLSAFCRLSQPVVTRVQGAAVGGGVGIVASSDYVWASHAASIRLSELEIGIGPRVISPFVRAKIGDASFLELALDTAPRDAQWCQGHQVFSQVCFSLKELDDRFATFVRTLAGRSRSALLAVKQISQRALPTETELLKLAKENAELLISSQHVLKMGKQ